MNRWNESQLEAFAPKLREMLERRSFRELRGALSMFESQDIALLFEHFDDREMLLLYRLLPKEAAAETFVEMSPDRQEYLIGMFSDVQLREVLEELYIDDTVELIEEMPAGVVKRMLSTCSKTGIQVIKPP